MNDKALQVIEEQRRIATLTGSMLDARTALRLCAPAEKKDLAKYNLAQSNEKASFRAVLYHLAQSLKVPEEDMIRNKGRTPTLIEDVIFTAVYKVYAGISGRRYMTDVRELQAFGFTSHAMSYNCIFDYLKRESFTEILQSLISLTASPFSHIEQNFAIDSTGFRIPKIYKWHDEKHGWRQRRQWIKCHACVGVKSHIVTAVKVTPRSIGDSPVLPELADATLEQFNVAQVAADGAYLSVKNLEHLDTAGIFPAIPFHSNHKVYTQPPGSVWRKMFHLFALNSVEYQEMINRQAQVESTFSMVKMKFGERIYSKNSTGQMNEVLCKVLCHNICVLVYWLYQFGVELPDVQLTENPPCLTQQP